MGLLQHTSIYGDIRKRTRPVTYPAGLALKGKAERLINHCVPHFDMVKNRLELLLNRLDCPCRAGIAAFHTQDAALLAGRNERRVRRPQAVTQIKKLNTSIGANLGALAASNAAAQEFVLSQGAWRTQIATRCRTGCSGAHKTCQETEEGSATGSFQEASSLHWAQPVRVNVTLYRASGGA